MVDLQSGHYDSPRWSWEILDCAMPMTFDTYSNCAHQCVYCFSFFQRAVGYSKDDYLYHKVRSVNVEKIKKMFTDPDKYAGQFAWYIKQRMVLQWGGLSDGFDWYERKFRKSLDLLKFFREIDYPISISTKGVWFLDDPEYTEAFSGAKNVQMKYSIITTNDQHAKKLEPGTPLPEERFQALERLKMLGVGVTTLRFRPYVLGLSDICVDDIFKRSAQAEVDSLTTEFLCIESRASNTAQERYRLIGEVTGIDTLKFYKENSFSGAGLLRLNYELKRPHFEKMEALAQSYNIPFYVSDAHHKERSLGTGCCGLPDNNGPLSNINRGQYAEALQIAKQKGRVHWSDISDAAEQLKNIPWARAQGYNIGNTRARAKYYFANMYDFMRDVWNTTKDINSPGRYFGGALVPGEIDQNGDIIYLYNEPLVKDGKHISSVADLTDYWNEIEGMKRDGGKFGHVAYPIFVNAQGVAAKNSKVIPFLQEAKLLFTVYVEFSQLEDYISHFHNIDIVPVPDGENILSLILQEAQNENLAACWMLRANIKGFFAEGEEDSARSVLSGVELLSERYKDWAIAGSASKKKYAQPFVFNKGVDDCLLVNLESGFNFNDFTPLSPFDFCLRVLDEGFGVIRSNLYTYQPGARKRDKDQDILLHQHWPSYTSLGADSSLKIHWNVFQFALRLKQ